MAAKDGAIVIHKHFGDPAIEAKAFSLKEGEVSGMIDMPDGTYAILRCDKRLPADTAADFSKELRGRCTGKC